MCRWGTGVELKAGRTGLKTGRTGTAFFFYFRGELPGKQGVLHLGIKKTGRTAFFPSKKEKTLLVITLIEMQPDVLAHVYQNCLRHARRRKDAARLR